MHTAEYPAEWWDADALHPAVHWCTRCWMAWMTPRRLRLDVPVLQLNSDVGHVILGHLYPDPLRENLRRAAFVVLLGPKSCQMRRLEVSMEGSHLWVLEYIILFLY